jgi:hypothetical protein
VSTVGKLLHEAHDAPETIAPIHSMQKTGKNYFYVHRPLFEAAGCRTRALCRELSCAGQSSAC